MAKKQNELLAPIESGGVRYAGDGATFIPGVPIRNLTADEWRELSDEVKALCISSGLYSLEG